MYTLQGKTRSTHHKVSILDPGRVPDHTSHVVHIGSLSLVPTRSNGSLHPKEILATKNRLAQPLSWVDSFFLHCDSLGVGERRFSQVVTQLHRLTGPIYQHAIGTFNTYSWGPTHRSLTDIGGSYNYLRALPSLQLGSYTIST
jgi:hypothetical protein